MLVLVIGVSVWAVVEAAKLHLDHTPRWPPGITPDEPVKLHHVLGRYPEAQVAHYLRHTIRCFRKRHGRPPGARWHAIPRSGIHALLRLAQVQWPPAPKATCAGDVLRFAICEEYETWLRAERGLARPSIAALMWEARHFLAWQLGRSVSKA